jgi:class 3 adenylate cyclase/tetratricopeptide (TPR) repeat protein
MQQIARWLEDLGLGQYAQRFADNDIDFDVLSELTDQDLEKLGVSLGHRRKLLRAVGELGGRTSATAPAGEAARGDGAERRQLTVMFTDLVGSTALSTKLDPEDLRAVIGAYHKCVAETVARFDGFVAKYMGDGVLIYFGYPQAHEDDAERAVRAGLTLIDAVHRLTTAEPLQVRIGVGTGLVVVGDIVGSGEAQERGVVGETPNLAARLQAVAAPNTIVIGPTTRRLLGDLFEYQDLGGVEAKGFAAPVRAYRVLRPSAVESRFEALHASALTALVGRQEEADLLLRRWQQANGGEGCVVLISGEAGIGKSRLAQNVLERLSGEPHTRLRYYCSPHHQDSALYPSITQLERAAGLRREDTDEQRLDKLEAVLALGTDDLPDAVPLLADLLSIPIGDRYPPLNLAPQKRKEKTLHAQLTQVEGLAARQPVLMVFEDIHWSDPTTRESLDLLIDRVPTLRVLVIITFRPEFTPPWVGRSHVTLLSLNRLPPRQRAEMIMGVTGGKALPREIADQIIDHTDGIPLFIEELTKSVVESGLLTEAEDHYTASAPTAPLAIPTTLHASLLARLDRLAPTREVAQIGAALGRSFSHELISAVAGMPQQQLDDALEQLVRAELMFRRGTPPDAEYSFKHALVQDAAYSTMLRSRRLQLHAQIGKVLVEQFHEAVKAQPALLAHHFTAAGMAEPAIEYFLKAGRQTLTRSAMVEAEALLRKGLNLVSGLPDSVRRQEHELALQIGLGQALFATQGWAAPGVGEAYARARQLCDQLDRPHKLLPILYGQWIHQAMRADMERAQRLAGEMQVLGEMEDDTVARVMGGWSSGFTCLHLGDFATARAHLERGLALFDPIQRSQYSELTPIDALVFLSTQLSLVLACSGYLDQARCRRDAGLAEARRLSHAHTLAAALYFASRTGWSARMQPDGLLQEADELLALSTEHGFAHWRALASVARGWYLSVLGQTEQGIPLLTNGLANQRGIGSALYRTHALTLLADACRIGGQPQVGLAHLAEADRLAHATQVKWVLSATVRLRGDLQLLANDRLSAEASFLNALAIARRQNAKIFELRSAMSLACLWRDHGKRQQAHDLLAPIYGWFTEGFDMRDLKEAKELLDKLT